MNWKKGSKKKSKPTIPPMNRLSFLMVDNQDSFTHNLVDYFRRVGHQVEIVSSQITRASDIDVWKYDGIVLSPGPGVPEESGHLMSFISQYAHDIPILGICLGHQALAQYFGAEVRHALCPMHGKTSLIGHDDHPIFADLPETFSVMRYHSLAVYDLEDTRLQPIAWTLDNENMALAHRDLPIIGLQFHPESILTDFGMQLVRNYCLWLAELKSASCRELRTIPLHAD